jgi:hypothetical protein
METRKIKAVQSFLNDFYGHYLLVDGNAGPKTHAALLSVPEIPTGWPKTRKLVGMLQLGLIKNGYEPGPVDGYWGPQTDYAYDSFVRGTKVWRDDEGIGATPTRWPAQVQSELFSFYGQVGENQGKATIPYTLKIAWNKKQKVNRFSCHEKVVRPIERTFERVLDHYGPEKITELGLDLFGGCLNVRKMRGGTKWSTHAWGIAIDMDPAENRLRDGCPTARMCGPEYNKWFDLWEEEGAVSLGRARNYDWMHIQFAEVK